jgi:hypothetical protein
MTQYRRLRRSNWRSACSIGNRRAHHGAVAVTLERGCQLEARLQQHLAVSPEELARRRAEFDKQKQIARGNRAA